MTAFEFSFRGLMAPVFTPFDEQKKINFKVIRDYAKYLHSNDIKGILVNGTTGEGVSLTTHERRIILEEWINSNVPLTIMVQVGGTNMEDVKSLARHAESCKVSSILCLPDLFFRPSSVDELIRYLKIISEEAPKTPLLYYHIPSFTGIKLNMRELLSRSLEIPTFAGIKFTDNDLDMGVSCVSVADGRLPVFLGCDTLWLPALTLGFDSAIGTTINMFPDHNKQILRFFKERNMEAATAVQRKLNHAVSSITQLGSWVSSMKAAMRTLTPIDVGPVRDPLVQVDIKKAKLTLDECLSKTERW